MTANSLPRVVSTLDPALQAGFVELIGDRFGLTIAHRQLGTLDDAVYTVMATHNFQSPQELYLRVAGAEGELLEEIVSRLTVGETHFFRIPPQIQALSHTVFPSLIGARRAARRLSVWIAGCSTGEEAYTVAMLLREQLPALEQWDTQIVATDINETAIGVAREGCYREWSFRETPDHVRRRYFTSDGKTWQLIDPVRTMVEFVQGNLVGNAIPALKVRAQEPDLILCRNVTIYFSAGAAQRLYRDLAAELSPGGWLILGPSDPPPQECDSLQPVYLSGAVLWRKRDSSGPRNERRASSVSRPPSVSARRTISRVLQPPVRTTPNASARAAGRGTDAPHRKALPASEAETEGVTEAETHRALGMQHLEEGNALAALDSLRRATFLDPNDAVAHFSLARAYLRLGRVDRARAALVHARRILATTTDGAQLLDGDSLSVDDLRHAVELQLRNLGDANGA